MFKLSHKIEDKYSPGCERKGNVGSKYDITQTTAAVYWQTVEEFYAYYDNTAVIFFYCIERL